MNLRVLKFQLQNGIMIIVMIDIMELYDNEIYEEFEDEV